jgi:hypothetical protein
MNPIFLVLVALQGARAGSADLSPGPAGTSAPATATSGSSERDQAFSADR